MEGLYYWFSRLRLGCAYAIAVCNRCGDRVICQAGGGADAVIEIGEDAKPLKRWTPTPGGNDIRRTQRWRPYLHSYRRAVGG